MDVEPVTRNDDQNKLAGVEGKKVPLMLGGVCP
jgi:hypothetical protein